MFMIFSFGETYLSFQLRVAAEDIASASIPGKSGKRYAGR
jgi:hypothetical protein